MEMVYQTDFKDLNLLKRGKVRDIYDLEDALLIVASDRISAFDVILPDAIPEKGKILTSISLFWFKIMESIVENHLISSDVDEYPDVCKPYSEVLSGRSMLVKKARPLPIECVVRGYISGSGWTSYKETGKICGIDLPDNLKESDKLPATIFTPSTKEDVGLHDINIDFNENTITIDKITVRNEGLVILKNPKTESSERTISAPNEIISMLMSKHQCQRWLSMIHHH